SARKSAGPPGGPRRRERRSTPRSPPPSPSTADCTPRALASKVETPARTTEQVQWTKCPSCDAFVYHKRLKRNLGVCPECNYHFRLPVQERIATLFDEGSFEDLSGDIEPVDALQFADSKPYAQRLEDASRKTGRREGALYGTATIGGQPLVVSIMDFAFIGGSMGGGVGEAITRGAELAHERKLPVLASSGSRGARMPASG